MNAALVSLQQKLRVTPGLFCVWSFPSLEVLNDD
jgi:hypothetical protein